MRTINKVAEITLLFWVMKVVATTLGETLGDFLSMTLEFGYLIGMGITFIFFIILLILQLNATQYIPYKYWLVIIATTTLGTEISDFMDRSLGVGYTMGSVLLVLLLIFTLLLWNSIFKNLRVYPILDRKKEIFYWVAILLSNSLGTAFGDYLSDEVGLSYIFGALVTAGVITIILLLHYFTNLNRVWLFWIAFIFTRPFGATFGDFLTKPISKGGLDLGTLPATLACMLLMGILVYIAHRKDSAPEKIKLT
ncbi:MAG: hypothetical protein WA951_02250 [Leeuwenhoekiella sp.]